MRFGVPFSELDTVFFGIGYEQTSIKGDVALPQNYFNYREVFGKVSSSVPMTIGWTRDGRDSALVPTAGAYERLNLEAGLLGDARYLRANAQYQQYVPLGRRFTIGFNAAYLVDFLKAAGSSEVRLELKDPQSAGQLRPAEGDDYKYRYIVMPMRI